MKRLIAAVVCLSAGLVGMVRAEAAGPAQVVVELYTSQGCSSCPPADAALAALAKRDDVIPLALHVDYWDYIGWKDTFADGAYANRQRAYARAAGARTVYTPQMIVGGMDHLVGAHRDKLDVIIRRVAARPARVALSLERSGGRVKIDAVALTQIAPATFVQLVRFSPLEHVEIRRGENAGRTIEYANVVTEWRRVAEWDGRAPLSMEVEVRGDAPVVVIVQEPGPGPILAARVLR